MNSPQTKKILHVSTFDNGGAGAAAHSWHKACLELGFESILITKYLSIPNNNNIIGFKKRKEKKGFYFIAVTVKNQFIKLSKYLYLGKTKPEYLFFNYHEKRNPVYGKKILRKIPFTPDVIILHFISGFLNSLDIQELYNATKARIFWVMMDNAPLTGGCHFPWNCKGFETNCTNCPAIFSQAKKKIASFNLAIKKQCLPTIELIAVSVSDFMRASTSVLFKHKKIHHFLLPIDENVFVPAEKAKSKAYYDISPRKKVIFFGASQLTDIRKGISYLLDALSILHDLLSKQDSDNYLLLIAGNQTGFDLNKINFSYKFLGYVNEDKLIKAYQAADVFVCPSVEDSGPMMINQSAMCATPIVAFEMGVAYDLVITGETGYRAKLKDSADLANGIKYILTQNKNDYDKMCDNCRKNALKLSGIKTFKQTFDNILKQ
jgi:glycosyltransferase involved in cell wall biosynthesis